MAVIIIVACCLETLCQPLNGSLWLVAVDEAGTLWPGRTDERGRGFDRSASGSGSQPAAEGRWRYILMENTPVNLDWEKVEWLLGGFFLWLRMGLVKVCDI